MTNEPDVSFSGNAGGMQPPGWYTYPPGIYGSTVENPRRVYIPYPFVPGRAPLEQNPADQEG